MSPITYLVNFNTKKEWNQPKIGEVGVDYEEFLV